ncbi:MAG TPA: prepilin-type N-terminal cleavage/methylation domain-containing protein [Candidatus Pacearchaeota archaeon]|nr:prepilin-type N-terminal cleavage/methylation domain-containing protein [Candidatus Pacearchaeota archaeon]
MIINRNKQKSFTLIELLVVIVIIGILAGVMMISTSSSIDKANFAKAQAFSSTVQEELLSNLVSEWAFDNASNIGEDTWGNNNGTLYNFANPATSISGLANASECVFGTCLRFDGANDYVDTNTYFKGGNKTISLWVNPSNVLDDYNGILGDWWWSADTGGEQDNLGLHLNKVYSRSFSDDTNIEGGLEHSNYNVVANSWLYIVLVTSQTSALYLNGSNIISNAIVITGENHLKTILIGIWRAGGTAGLSRPFNGLIDDVRIYDIALTSAQIKQNYIAGLDSLLSKGMISSEDYDNKIAKLAEKE